MIQTLPRGVVFSVSTLDAFEICPRNYEASHITKEIPFTTSAASEAGKLAHKQLEDYVMAGTPLPLGLLDIKRTVDAVTVGAQQVMAERRVALSWDLRPVGFFDDDVAYRGVVDLTILRDDAVIIADYKTGSEPRETFLQLRLNALAVLQEFPQYRTVHMLYLYTKHAKRRSMMERDEIPELLAEIYPRVERIRLARESGEFPPKKGWKCRFCSLRSCVFNPKYEGDG